jgi:DNA polymerase
VLGPGFRVTRDRSKPLTGDLAPVVIATAHPSSVLRAPDDASRHEAHRLLVSDLEVVARELRKRPPGRVPVATEEGEAFSTTPERTCAARRGPGGD